MCSITTFLFSKTPSAELSHEARDQPWQLTPLLVNVYKSLLWALEPAGLAFRARQCRRCGCCSWLCCQGGGCPCAAYETSHKCLNWPKMATLWSEAFFHFAQGRIMSVTPSSIFQKHLNARSMQFNLFVQMVCVYFVMHFRHWSVILFKILVSITENLNLLRQWYLLSGRLTEILIYYPIWNSATRFTMPVELWAYWELRWPWWVDLRMKSMMKIVLKQRLFKPSWDIQDQDQLLHLHKSLAGFTFLWWVKCSLQLYNLLEKYLLEYQLCKLFIWLFFLL